MNRKYLEQKPIKNFWKYAVAVAVAMMFLIPGSAVVANESDTVVSIQPVTKTVEKGETFDLYVYIEPAEPVCAGAIMNINFDATLLQVDAVELQGFFDPYETMGSTGIIDNVNGMITDIYEFTVDTSIVETTNNFLKITFTADASKLGTTAIDLVNVDILRPDASAVPVAVFDGEVIVGEGSSAEWDVTLNFNEDGGKLDYTAFGEALDANDGDPPDSYDMPKPPPPQPPYLRAWFEDGLPEPYTRLWGDYRRYPDTEKTWELYVIWKCSISNLTDITISWDVGGFTGCEYNSVVLWRYDPFDQEWDFAADMLVSNNYVYTPRWFNEQWLTDQFQIRALNNPPNTPSNPNPDNGATGIDINADLSWTGGDPDNDPVSYDFYFGTISPPPLSISRYSQTTYDPGILNYDTQYYWQIVAWDNYSDSSGPIWSFTTTKSSNGDPGPGPGPGPGQNEPPIADADGPYIGAIGIPVTFDGSGSSDPDGDITNYTWHFGDGTEGYGEITDHVYAESGNYTVTLLVTDNSGKKRSNLTCAIITGVANNPPNMPMVTGSGIGQNNIIYNYTAVSTDPDNDTIRYFFDWGDGNNTASDFFASGTIYNTSHNWTDSGVYTVRVYAKDINNGVSGTTEMTVFIDVNKQFIDDVIQGYLLDTDNDGIYDIFHNNATGDETDLGQDDDGNYLIDVDGDGDWDYTFDLISGLSTYQKEEEQKKTPGFELIIIVCAIAVFLFWKRKRRDVY